MHGSSGWRWRWKWLRLTPRAAAASRRVSRMRRDGVGCPTLPFPCPGSHLHRTPPERCGGWEAADLRLMALPSHPSALRAAYLGGPLPPPRCRRRDAAAASGRQRRAAESSVPGRSRSRLVRSGSSRRQAMRQREEGSSRHASSSRSDLAVTQRPLECRVAALPPPMRLLGEAAVQDPNRRSNPWSNWGSNGRSNPRSPGFQLRRKPCWAERAPPSGPLPSRSRPAGRAG